MYDTDGRFNLLMLCRRHGWCYGVDHTTHRLSLSVSLSLVLFLTYIYQMNVYIFVCIYLHVCV